MSFERQVDNVVIYQNDHLGTPQKLTAINGAVVWSAKYSSFGEAHLDASSSITNNLRFPGQYFDEETGLHYNFNRYYSNVIGFYLREDPIGMNGGINLYQFVKNNPINKIDPLGLNTWSGAGDEIGGFLVFYGRSTMIGFMKNWETGESCEIMTTCDKLGIGLGGGVTAHSLWMFNGPKCGKDIPGVSVGGGAEGGVGAYVAGGPAGTAGASPDAGEGHAIGVSGGGGIGVGGAMYGQHCKTVVLSCKNTPCECK